ncbi:MAG: CoA-binding protein [Desulfobacterales bacterium]|nr:MAG: CoA-binding protein [Desulfobacterales bacterium]
MKITSDLQKLISPGSIAVIGATSKKDRVGHIIFENLMRSELPLFPVHPREKEVSGYATYHEIESLPDNIDLAIIAIGAQRAVEAAERCARHGIPQIIVVAGGFSEAGTKGKLFEDRLRTIPKMFGSRILGPNTLGLFIPHNNLDTIFVEHGDRALSGGGGVAFISQSGSVGVEALGLASNTGYGMRAFIGLGNKCDLDELDFLQYFGMDHKTTCLAFYLESFDHGRMFLEQARKIAAKKPVVVLKAGRSKAGASAVSSHTGRLAGSDQVVTGAFRQFGIQRVYDDEELCDASKTLAALPPSFGNRIAILTPAGGYGVMGADHIETQKGGVKLAMATLSPITQERIRSFSLPFASCRNPVDLTASADNKMIGDTLDALLDDDNVDIIICTAFFAPPSITDGIVDEISSRAVGSKKPVIVFTQYGPFTDGYLRRFHENGVIGFPSIGRSVRAAKFLVERAIILKALG